VTQKITSIADAERAQQRLRERFGRLRGVRGIGVTWDERGNARIRINVDSDLRRSVGELIPSELDGVAIELRSVRDFKTFADNG
jgi:hypothetical protein